MVGGILSSPADQPQRPRLRPQRRFGRPGGGLCRLRRHASDRRPGHRSDRRRAVRRVFNRCQNKWKIDDVLGVWPLHGFCGAFGGIACGVFGQEALGGMGGVSLAAQLFGTALGVASATLSGFCRLWPAEGDDGSPAVGGRGIPRRRSCPSIRSAPIPKRKCRPTTCRRATNCCSSREEPCPKTRKEWAISAIVGAFPLTGIGAPDDARPSHGSPEEGSRSGHRGQYRRPRAGRKPSADAAGVSLRLIMTSPACPQAGYLADQAAAVLREIFGSAAVSVDIASSPLWDPTRMSPAARRQLGRT